MPRKQALKLIFLPTNNQIKVACLAHQDTLKLTYIILEFQKFSGGETSTRRGMPLPDERVAWEGEEDEGLWRDNEEEGEGKVAWAK